MKYLDWSLEKNEKLKTERGVNFEQAAEAIIHDLIKVEKNPSKKHLNQKIFIVIINNYCYLVPFIKTGDKIFLKTIIPSKKATKKYIKSL